MKNACLILSILLFGCSSHRTEVDSFRALHKQVASVLVDQCNCGPLSTNGDLGRFFEISIPDSRIGILVGEEEFFTSDHWLSIHQKASNDIDELWNREPLNAQDSLRLSTAIRELQRLPEWSFQATGVSVSIQDPDIWYEGYPADRSRAKTIFQKIVLLLEPYETDRLQNANVAPPHRSS